MEMLQSAGEKVGGGGGVLLRWVLSLPQPLDQGLRIAVSSFQHSTKEKFHKLRYNNVIGRREKTTKNFVLFIGRMRPSET